MARYRRRVRAVERRLKPDEDPSFRLILYDSDEDYERQLAELPATVQVIVAITSPDGNDRGMAT